jgi:hypothetical protein
MKIICLLIALAAALPAKGGFAKAAKKLTKALPEAIHLHSSSSSISSIEESVVSKNAPKMLVPILPKPMMPQLPATVAGGTVMPMGGNIPLQNFIQQSRTTGEIPSFLNALSPSLSKAFKAQKAAKTNRLMIQFKTFGRVLSEVEHDMLSGVIRLQQHAKTRAEFVIAVQKLRQYESLFSNRQITARESRRLKLAIERDLSATNSL